jgi:hypothetical protein
VLSLQAAALFLFPVAAGVVAGYAAGGSLAGLISIRLRALWLLWLAAGLQAIQLAGALREVRGPLLAAVFALAAAWLAVNLAGRPRVIQAAAALALAGGLANGAAIAANGRMPYLPAAARAAGLSPGARTPKNIAAGPASHLIGLGDIIPVPPLDAVISAGDILIIAGVIALIAAAMRQVPGRRPIGGPRQPREEVTQ